MRVHDFLWLEIRCECVGHTVLGQEEFRHEVVHIRGAELADRSRPTGVCSLRTRLVTATMRNLLIDEQGNPHA